MRGLCWRSECDLPDSKGFGVCEERVHQTGNSTCESTEARETLLCLRQTSTWDWPKRYWYEGPVKQEKVRSGKSPLWSGKISWILSSDDGNPEGHLGRIMACWENLPGRCWRTDQRGQDWKAGEWSHGLAKGLSSHALLRAASPAALRQTPSSKGPTYLFQVISPTPTPWASFPELPMRRWAGEIVRLIAWGSTSPASRGRETFLLWKAWDSSLTTAPRSLLSNGRFPLPLFKFSQQGRPRRPHRALSLPMAPPTEAAEGTLSQGPLHTPWHTHRQKMTLPMQRNTRYGAEPNVMRGGGLVAEATQN